jgi:alkylation response protein AidB-like acyl-CoA dehydrogenase
MAALRGEISFRYLKQFFLVLICFVFLLDNGSDAANLKTSARLEGDHYVLNGTKLISPLNAAICTPISYTL